MKLIIAIDGYSSSGKSTMARHLAREIGYCYIDTGAMYRSVTLWAMHNGLVDPKGGINEAELVKNLDKIKIDFIIDPSTGLQRTRLNGEDVENEIRTMEVSSLVSPVAAIAEVRRHLVKLQQAMGHEGGIVMDGRDIGTVVFPEAQMKIFCDASAEKRAMRRMKELQQKGHEVTYEQVLENVRERDRIDSTRAEGPLRCADDAIRLDNSDMTIDEQNRFLLDTFKRIEREAAG